MTRGSAWRRAVRLVEHWNKKQGSIGLTAHDRKALEILIIRLCCRVWDRAYLQGVEATWKDWGSQRGEGVAFKGKHGKLGRPRCANGKLKERA